MKSISGDFADDLKACAERNFPPSKRPNGAELLERIAEKLESRESLSDFEILLFLFGKTLDTLTRDEIGFEAADL